MARRKATPPVGLPGNTMVELVAHKGKKSAKTEMELDDARIKKAEFEKLKKWRGWKFQIFQLGFSAFKNE